MSKPSLEAAFRATTYRVETSEGPFDLRIGRNDPAFDHFLHGQGVCRWGILTACNPGALHLSAEENQCRQEQLLMRLRALGCLFFAGCNVADQGDWPPEASCLILQLGEDELRTLARAFSQLAVVCGDTGSPPRLLWV
jgi:hypothetical protein